MWDGKWYLQQNHYNRIEAIHNNKKKKNKKQKLKKKLIEKSNLPNIKIIL